MSDHFLEFKSGGERYLKDLIEMGIEEGVGLEFKSLDDPNMGKLNKVVKRNLGKELSAFSNSAGGVIIFGVETETVSGVDIARRLKPIKNISSVSTEISRLCEDYLSPKHSGISVAHQLSENDRDQGFICIAVERSERRPHMSNAPDDKRYYRRIGSSAYIMEHFDVEDMMARKRTAEVEFDYSLSVAVRAGNLKRFKFFLLLRNPSEVTAFDPLFEFKDVIGFSGRSNVPGFNQVSGEDRWTWCRPDVGIAINPSQALRVVSLKFDIHENRNGEWWFETESKFGFIYRYGCRDRSIQQSFFEMSQSEMAELIASSFKIDMVSP